MGVKRHFQHYFSHVVAVSFIGGVPGGGGGTINLQQGTEKLFSSPLAMIAYVVETQSSMQSWQRRRRFCLVV
jgi:hypothetical protein